MKKLSILSLLLLLVGQTIFGPLLTLQANAIGTSQFSFSEKRAAVSSPELTEDSTVTLEYGWTASGELTEDVSFSRSFPAGLEAVRASGTAAAAGAAITYTVAGGQITAVLKGNNTQTAGTFTVEAKLKNGSSEFTFAGTAAKKPEEKTEVPMEDTADSDTGVAQDQGGQTPADQENGGQPSSPSLPEADTPEAPAETDDDVESQQPPASPEAPEAGEPQNPEPEEGPVGEEPDKETPAAEFDPFVNEDAITHIVAKKDGKKLQDIENYRPKIGDSIQLEFSFTLPSNHNYGEGSTLTYTLPELLKTASGQGPLTNENGEKYADYKVQDGKVIITFNEKIRFTGQGGTGGLEVSGNFNIQATYTASAGGTDLDQILKLPGEEEILLTFQPIGGTDIKKSATAENNGNNSQYVTWTVDVNTSMRDLGESGETFKDTLNGNHVYKADTLKIERYQLNAEGVAGEKADVTADIQTSGFTEASKEFTAVLKGRYAYTLTYETIPGETEESGQTVSNTATFNGKEVGASSPIRYGDPLKKSVKQNGNQANWTVNVNENRKKMAAGTTVTDTWVKNAVKHQFVGDIIVTGADFTQGTDYTITKNADGFVLELLTERNEPFAITYTTEPKDLITETIDLQNKVVRSDRITDVKNASTTWYSQGVLTKHHANVNYQAKTIDWTIRVNGAGYEMDNLVLTDLFVDKNLSIEGSLKVVDEQGAEVPHTFTSNGKEGFILKFTSPVTKPVNIAYTTKYDVSGVENIGTYRNQAGIQWSANNKDYKVENVTDSADINNQQKNKGYKTGTYNYNTKRFNWSVGINYNFDTITDPVFKDTLSDSQEILKNSIKVFPLDLMGGGNGIPDTNNPFTDYDVAIEGSSFTLTFKEEITGPYQIVYESKNKDDFYEPDGQKETVNNNATLNGGTYGEWDKGVSVEHTEHLIGKSVQQNGTSAKVAWSIKLNWSQSDLRDVVITDTIGKDAEGNPNQKIYEDTLKICDVTLDENSGKGTIGTCHKPGTGLYDVVFDESGASFTIKFKKPITNAYVVQYDAYFLGASGNKLENTAKLTYHTLKTDVAGSDESKYDENFTFGGSASAKKGQLVITKVDADDSSAKLPGAVFELWSAKTNGFLIESGTTGSDGVYEFKTKVGQGTYYLKETQAPDGYVHNGQTYKDLTKIDIKADSEETLDYVKKLEVSNKKVRQSFELTKTDAQEGSVLKGVTFKLQKKNGASYEDVAGYGELRTNQDGKINVEDLEAGDYRLIETATLSTHWLDGKPLDFTIHQNQTAVTKLSMVNSKVGSFQLTKTDAEDAGILLPGAHFTLTYKGEGGEPSYTAVTDENGIADFGDVKYGTYTLTETAAPSGYVAMSGPVEVVIDEATNTLSAPITNEKIKQAVRLTKTDQAEPANKLAGAEFVLYNSAGEIVKDKDGSEIRRTTDSNGEIAVNHLEPGTFYFLETKAPAYHLLPTDEADRKTANFTIQQNQTVFTEVSAVNKRGAGSIVLTKVDAGDDAVPLKDVEFTLYDTAGKVQDKQSTDAAGKITFSDVPYGKYTVVETKEKEGYVPDDTKRAVELTADTDGHTVTLEPIENTKIDRSVQLTKTNGDGSLRLSGAVFELHKKNPATQEYELVTLPNAAVLITNNEGILLLENLEAGEYRLVETKAPAGYVLNKVPVEFSIEQYQTQPKKVTKENQRVYYPPTTGDLKILKVDRSDSGKRLQGAKFIVKNGSQTVAAVVTDSQGIAYVTNLPFGTYTIEETEAPAGYQLSKEPVHVQIDSSGTKEITMENTKKPDPVGSLRIVKTDADDPAKKLAGAIFTVSNDTHTISVRTNQDGIGVIKELPAGTYTVIETAAPDGYQLSDKVLEVVIEDGKTIEMTIQNKKLDVLAGSIQVTKVDSENPAKTLEKAEFEVLFQNKVVAVMITGKDGTATAAGLPYGSYTIRETKAPVGYVKTDQEVNVAVNRTTPIDVTIENEKEKSDPSAPGTGVEGTPGEPEKPGDTDNQGTPGKPTVPNEPSKPGKPGQSAGTNNPNASDSGSKLPQTGEAYPIASITAGILLILLGGWLLVTRRKKERRSRARKLTK